jgi:hypothetical protein
MSPPPEKDDSVEVEEPENRPDEVADDEATQKQASKRRTKTGCLSKSPPLQLTTRLEPAPY